MTQDEITKAFNGRWNMKSKSHPEAWVKGVKELCRDFFEAGVLIGEGEHCPPISMSAIENAAYEVVGFEEWWSLYQKKRGRDRCMKKWNKLTLKEKQECIQATPAYVASTPDKAFRKDPYTYLHNKSWHDEIIIRHNPEHQRQQRLADAANLVAKYTGADKRDKE